MTHTPRVNTSFATQAVEGAPDLVANSAFSRAERDAVYRAIFERRDMRHFAGGSVAPDAMRRLLTAAHHAPRVGFMQPWRFVRVASRALRTQLQALVEQARVLTARALGQREDAFMRLKVEGLLDAAEVWAVALADLLYMPAGAQPIALLCIGPVDAFYDEPMLQKERWTQRCALDDLIFEDAWGKHPRVIV